MSLFLTRMHLLVTFTVILVSGCATSNTHPAIHHIIYGLVDTRHPEFKKDAHECAVYMRGGQRSSVTIDPANIILDEKLTAAINASYTAHQVQKIFNTSQQCINKKGWTLAQD